LLAVSVMATYPEALSVREGMPVSLFSINIFTLPVICGMIFVILMMDSFYGIANELFFVLSGAQDKSVRNEF